MFDEVDESALLPAAKDIVGVGVKCGTLPQSWRGEMELFIINGWEARQQGAVCGQKIRVPTQKVRIREITSLRQVKEAPSGRGKVSAPVLRNESFTWYMAVIDLDTWKACTKGNMTLKSSPSLMVLTAQSGHWQQAEAVSM